MNDSIRCFIALPVDAEIRQGVRELVTSLKELPTRISWVRSENLHLTLRFLGDQREGNLPSLKAALQSACKGISAFTIHYKTLGAFPPKGGPRTLWVGVSGELEVLHRLNDNLARELERMGILPDKRSFSPHLTIGRVRGHLTLPRWSLACKGLGNIDLGQSRVNECKLIQSELQKGQPPVYSQLATVELGEPS